MTLRKFLLILKARFLLISLIFITFVSFAIIYSLLAPKIYKASTSLVLNYKGIDPVTGVVLPAQLMPGYMATQMNIISSRNVALKVVDDLNLTDIDKIQEQYNAFIAGKSQQTDIRVWLADRLLKGLDVEPDRESSVLEITYEGNDPAFSALLANAFARAYQEANVELKVEPAKKASNFFEEQIEVLKQKLEKAQTNLTAYQLKNGITGTTSSLDIEVAKLNEISSQLVIAQAQLYDSNSRNSNSSNNPNSPDVAQNPIVQQLKLNVSMAETKLSEISELYGINHPLYKSTKAELSKHKVNLSNAISSARKNIRATSQIDKNRVSQLKAALKQQKDRVLKLNLASNELTVLQNEVFSAQKALDAVNVRFTEKHQESSSNQSDITVLNPAVPPDSAASPNLLINMVIAIFLGAVFGVGSGLLRELMDQRVRTKNDVVDLLEVPVFSLSKPRSKVTKQLAATSQMLLE